jgi:hypothetical protein
VFWERWDASPNRQIIHDIIEKVEENEAGKSHRRSRRTRGKDRKRSEHMNKEGMKAKEGIVGDADHDPDGRGDHEDHDDGCSTHGDCSDDGVKPGLLGRFVRFIGEMLLWAN